MALSGNNRGQAIYDALAAGGSLARLNDDEKAALLAQLKTVWAADTTYLTANATITPNTLAAQSGIPVSTTGTAAAQTGVSTAPGPLSGTGKLT